jgi:hypothetical protein
MNARLQANPNTKIFLEFGVTKENPITPASMEELLELLVENKILATMNPNGSERVVVQLIMDK